MSRLAIIAIVAAAALDTFCSARPARAEDSYPSEAVQRELSLAVGESATIPTSDISRYSEGTPGVVTIHTAPDKFIVNGVAAGSTSLLLFKKDGTEIKYLINVFSRRPEIVEGELQQLLEGYTGLRVRRVGSRLFIDGGVGTEGDRSRIEQIAKVYKGQVESLVTVGSSAIDRKINIRIDVFFVQYNKSSGYAFGISWPGHIGFDPMKSAVGVDFMTGGVTAQAALVAQPLPGLDIAAGNGWAKVLKQATVITTNGSEATFNNGGEINVGVTTGMVAGVQKVSYGTNLRVLPRYDPKTRNIEVQVSVDVSDPTSPGPLPTLQTSRLSTLVFMKLDQSLVLSGIHARSQTHQVSGVPLLSEIPVLGVLFGSHGDAKEEVEGSLILVPSVVDNVERSASAVLNDALKQYEKYAGNTADVHPFEETPRTAPAGRTPGAK